MSKKLVVYLIFFTVLLGGFLFFTFVGTDYWKVKIPVISVVKPFNFINQDGQKVTVVNLQGKVTVVEYFFTTCKGICPKLNTNMKDIYVQYKDRADFQIFSHTCNPETDSVSVLKRFSDSLQVDTKKWIFLTGPKEQLYLAARESYKLDDPKNNVASIKDQFIHTQLFALVDRKGNVRGMSYDGLKSNDIQQLKVDIVRLLNEK
jgi:protein SCO1/2